MDPRAPHVGEIIQEALRRYAPSLPELTPEQRIAIADAVLDALRPAAPNWAALGIDDSIARS